MIGTLFDNFYSELFNSFDPRFPQYLHGLIMPSISNNMNDELCSVPSLDLIKSTVFDLPKRKSPGPEKMNSSFNKTYRHTLGKIL